MANYRKIMDLLLSERSYRDIATIVGCSQRDIARTRRVINEHGITSSQSITDEDLTLWLPDRRRVVDEYDQPDFEGVLDRRRHQRHFTLLQAWRRYTDAVSEKKKYGYSQFCALFAEYVNRNDLVGVLHHEPGRAMLVDWAGDTLDIVDAVDGVVSKAYLFVAVLPYSGLIYCQAFLNMKTPAWLDAHMAAFAYCGGVVQIVVPDNPTTSTHRRTRGDGERVINARYQDMADHYGVAIVPARVKKPRDKAAVENAVNVVNKRVIGYLDAEVFESLDELREAVAERVHEINYELVRADDTTRIQRFDAEEAHLLAPLPDTRFEEVEWKQAKAGRNYHVRADYQHYSVPYQLAGQILRVRLTATRVTIFNGSELVCDHRRRTGRKGQYSTLPEHVPIQHHNIDGLWSASWFTRRAQTFGPATVAIIEDILTRHTIEAQGYLDCQNILSGLGKKNKTRLEAACQELLNRGGYPTYTTLKRLMAAINSDQKVPAPIRPAASTRKHSERGVLGPDVYVRDASHYDLPEPGEA